MDTEDNNRYGRYDHGENEDTFREKPQFLKIGCTAMVVSFVLGPLVKKMLIDTAGSTVLQGGSRFATTLVELGIGILGVFGMCCFVIGLFRLFTDRK